jgi:hypothetical protein
MQRKRTKRELVLNQFESIFAQNDSKIIKIEKNTHTYFDEMRTHFLLIFIGKIQSSITSKVCEKP